MTKRKSGRLHRRTLLTGSAALSASAIIACDTGGIAIGRQKMARFDQNTVKRRGVGLRGLNEERAFPGFTLFAPLTWENRSVYLIDLQGNVIHTWNMPYPPGLSGYLTERGTLFYNGRTSEDSFLSRFPFKGGVVLEADWNGKVLWEVRHPNHHHHGVLLRNGNVLLNCMGQVPDEIARQVKGGAEEDGLPSGQYAPRPEVEVGRMYSDYLAEVTPAGKTVWEWRTWEHLDPAADGITEVQAPRTMWAQGNSVMELPDGDILASYRPTSTVLRISRTSGKILWKLGSPTLAGQHAPTLLRNGNILIFDNGVHRLDDSMPFSRVIEVNPATNEIVWTYQDRPAWNFFSPRMGNAQRLPNGNTLICEGYFGRLFEVTKDGEIVWEYVNPFFGRPFFAGTAAIEGNVAFRALRYSADEIAAHKAKARAAFRQSAYEDTDCYGRAPALFVGSQMTSLKRPCNNLFRRGGYEMVTLGRRSFLKSATLVTAGGIVTSSAVLPGGPSLGQGAPANSQYGVKALFFDMFGTTLDWRTGVARSAEAILKPRGYSLDWLTFADAWRALYDPQMDEVRSGRIPYAKLDVLHRRMLDLFLPRFGITGLSEDVLHDLTLSWHRLDAWPDVASALPRLSEKFLLAPVSNANISLAIDNARRNGIRFDAILGADIAQDYKPKARVFQAAAEAFDLKPSECMMVTAAAHDFDIIGAVKAGLRTAAVARPDEFGPGSSLSTPRDPVDIIAKDFNELADKLGA